MSSNPQVFVLFSLPILLFLFPLPSFDFSYTEIQFSPYL
jgi:hypothetical protein